MRVWLEGQAANRTQPQDTLVVAAEPLRYGMELNEMNLREIEWPRDAIPEGAFRKKSELLQDDKRVALSAIEADEPILQKKITGPGQRATLSALIDPNMTAVTVRVNDVGGVGGFVLPGDYVDVFLTRTERRGDEERNYTDVLLQNVRVLGVDQVADDRTDKPKVVKAVTLEVTTEAAQKVVLASSVGQLSLTLRSAGSLGGSESRRVTAGDLGRPSIVSTPGPQQEKKEEKAGETSEEDPYSIVGVTRSLKRSTYSVLRTD
jgi:pilus assembly protein CpaB